MRYARQAILEEIGSKGQEKLRSAAVLCIGAGGLGSPALLYLAAAGVGRIGVVDFDRVEESNLQRQILYTTTEAGEKKATKARERLGALNPEIEIDAHDTVFSTDNAPELLGRYDLVLDGSDNFDTKYLVGDAAFKFGKTWIYGAIQGFEGQAAVFSASPSCPCYRCLYPAPPRVDTGSCAQRGVIGAVAGLVGVTQALQAIQIIVGHARFQPLIGKLWRLDTWTMESRIHTIPKNPLCPLCSQGKDAVKLPSFPPSLFCTAPLRAVTPLQAATMTEAVFWDVREQEEWDAGHIPGALHCPLSALLSGARPALPAANGRPVVVYCAHGARSQKAIGLLQKEMDQEGPSLYNLTGGYVAWEGQIPKGGSSFPS